MKKPFKIGQKEYKFKKDAIAHYRAILNSYDFGQTLNGSDYDDLIDLIEFDYFNNLVELESMEVDVNENSVFDKLTKVENEKIETKLEIEDVKTGRVQVNTENLRKLRRIRILNIKVARDQFNTKCFEIFENN